MTAAVQIVAGDPTGEETAAVTSAVQVLLEAESLGSAPEPPWAYRSAWRQAAIEEGMRGTDVS